MERTRELARITSADIGEAYNGMVGLTACFSYEDNGAQYLGAYMLCSAMVIRFMGAVGVTKLSEAAGRSCWVTHDSGKIYRIEPLHKGDGEPFDIEEWQAWARTRMQPTGITYSELRGRA